MSAPETHEAFVERVRGIVARHTLDGPLPTWFEVYGDGDLQRAAIVRAKMARINSRVPMVDRDDLPLCMTTAREVMEVGLTDDEIAERLFAFALSLYEHECCEWFRRDGVLVDDPHADDPGMPR